MAALPRLRRKDSTPAKQVTGTSYSAQGAVPIDPVDYNEIGSSKPAGVRDIVPELANRASAVRTYRKMIRTDVSVRISLRAGKAPVLGGDYYVEPFDEEPDNLAIQEFVEFNLFHAIPWLTTLNRICKNYEDGSSVFETVWELREWAPKKTSAGANRRKYTMLRKLAVRPMDTISEFLYDDAGGPAGVKHKAIRADGDIDEEEIKIGKLIIFPFDEDGGNLEGESILRSAYESWFYKYHLYKIDAIQKERHGIGVPDIALQPGYSQKDLAWAHELGRNLRTNERAHIVRTTMMEVGFAELKGQLVDPLASAKHHDNQIMKNIMVQFLNLGIETGGGRATGATSMDMFLKSMRFIAQSICDAFNLYLIPRLVAYNFKTDKFPQLQVKNVGETKDLQMWAAAMANLVKNNVITMDDATEQWVRTQMDAPAKQEPRPKIALPSGVASPTKNGKTGGNGGPDETTGNVGRSDNSGAAL